MRRVTDICIVVLMAPLVSISWAQQPFTTAIPNMIRYGGTLNNTEGAALASATMGVTFAIYKQQDGGSPIWLETQNVTTDAHGGYTVVLGETRATGLPSDLFSQQEQRWLGVRVEGQAEQPRVLLVSVPYAFKESEAESLGGHSANEFVTSDTLQSAVQQQLQQQVGATSATTVNSTTTSLPNLYIWNFNAFHMLQPNTSFNIDGNGSVGNAYQLHGTTVLTASFGDGNLLVGLQAGNSKITGFGNTFAGYQAGFSNTDGGSHNSFYGFEAGHSNIGQYELYGSNNTFAGYEAGLSNTQGSDNTFYGASAGLSNTVGGGNTFIGWAAGNKNTKGEENTFLGDASGANNKGNRNTFIGARAGINNKTGRYNTFLGVTTGFYNKTGNSNIYIANSGPIEGAESNTIRIGDPNTSDDSYQTVAYIAGIYGQTTASGSPVLVDSTGKLGTTGGNGLVTSFNKRSGAVFPAAGDYSFALLNGSLGDKQLKGAYGNAVTLSNTSNVFDGTFIGNGSGLNDVLPAPGSPNYIQNGTMQQPKASFNVDGSGSVGGTYQWNGTTVLAADGKKGNLLVGFEAGNSKPAGFGNTLSGYQAGFSTTQGASGNSFYGYQAGYRNTGQSDIFGSDNTFIGYKAGFSNTQGRNNTFVGMVAGAKNTTGSANSFIGGAAGDENTEGDENTFFGHAAGSSNIQGNRNTFIGLRAGIRNTTGTYNTFIGAVSGFFNKTRGSNIYIANLGPKSGEESNTIRIGDPNTSDDNYQTAAYIAGIYSSTSPTGVPVFVNSDGLLGTQTSSLRFKEQVRDMGDSTDGLLKLRPVTFFYKPEYDKGLRALQYGLIAEEVAPVYPELVANDNEGNPYTVRYQYLTTMLLNEVQKQYHRAEAEARVVEAQQDQIQILQKQNEDFQRRLSRLEAKQWGSTEF